MRKIYKRERIQKSFPFGIAGCLLPRRDSLLDFFPMVRRGWLLGNKNEITEWRSRFWLVFNRFQFNLDFMIFFHIRGGKKKKKDAARNVHGSQSRQTATTWCFFGGTFARTSCKLRPHFVCFFFILTNHTKELRGSNIDSRELNSLTWRQTAKKNMCRPC